MNRKLAFIAAAVLLMTAGCGNIEEGGEPEENTTVSDTEISSEEETSETVSEEEETAAAETTASEETTEVETTEAPKASDNADASDYFKVLTDVKPGMKRDEVFAIIGDGYTYEEEYIMSTGYIYPFEHDDIFGTGLKGDMFVEFNQDNGCFRCGGFHLGTEGVGDSTVYLYSEDELREAFDKIMPILTATFGEDYAPTGINGDGIISDNEWKYGNEELWAMWGTDLWGEKSGINEILVSHSAEQ